MEPRPIDQTVLYAQASHRSSTIWDGQQMDFYELSHVGFILLDWHSITMFAERWHPETHTFHLPLGECTITLEDINIQLGLSVNGLPVIDSTRQDWRQIMFLPLLADFKAAGHYSWGSAGLAWLYRELCKASRIDAHDIAGPLILLQVWVWYRFPSIAPRRLLQPPIDPIMDLAGGDALPAGPLAMRWRDAFEVMEIVWQPHTPLILAGLPDYCFSGQHIWRCRVTLLYFFIVEWHYPDRVMHQFGLRQTIPESRQDCIVDDPAANGMMDYYDDYMKWYCRITRRFICRGGAMIDYMSIEETTAHFKYAVAKYEGLSEGSREYHIKSHEGSTEDPGEHRIESHEGLIEGPNEHRTEEGPSKAPPMGLRVQPTKKKRRPPCGT
ncbi:serine/threonine-protein phosphatase 7 long form homolog [Elaeis guineensis]|uniref:serine/threonine-protein phosphatase 7 long form homolog n=1 Tax=Elaeis guineensis var. tenera TaxID=51953 RepID=UPI003C6D2688